MILRKYLRVDEWNINWEYVALYSMYAFFGLVILLGISAIQNKRIEAEEHCTDKKGILLQDKSGTFYCIREKAMIK